MTSRTDRRPRQPDLAEFGERLAACRDLIEDNQDRAQLLLTELFDECASYEPAIAAECAHLLARMCVRQSAPLDALRHVTAARALCVQAGDELTANRTDLGRIHILNDLGRHADAVEVGAQLLENLSVDAVQSDETIWLRSSASENTGPSYGWLAHHSTALDYYDESATVYERLGLRSDLARVSTNRAAEYLELGQHRPALTLLDSARSVFEEDGDLHSLAVCDAYLARGHALAGSYGSAIRSLEQATADVQSLTESAKALRVSLTWADVLLLLNLTEQTIERCAELVPRFAERGMIRDEGLSELLLARAHAADRNTSRGLEALDRAEARFIEADLHVYSPWDLNPEPAD